jgi:hypothetical protein
VVNNYIFNGDGHAITISAHPTSAGAVPPPAKKGKRRKRPNKAEKRRRLSRPDGDKPSTE